MGFMAHISACHSRDHASLTGSCPCAAFATLGAGSHRQGVYFQVLSMLLEIVHHVLGPSEALEGCIMKNNGRYDVVATELVKQWHKANSGIWQLLLTLSTAH